MYHTEILSNLTIGTGLSRNQVSVVSHHVQKESTKTLLGLRHAMGV